MTTYSNINLFAEFVSAKKKLHFIMVLLYLIKFKTSSFKVVWNYCTESMVHRRMSIAMQQHIQWMCCCIAIDNLRCHSVTHLSCV